MIEKIDYGLNWIGKSTVFSQINKKISTSLIEDKKFNEQPENKNSGNMLIRGDNLEALRHLSGNYVNRINMIYIDPPYNTGKSFMYQDKFGGVDFIQEVLDIEKKKAREIYKKLGKVKTSHSAWLTFMYPRLYIAKQLLKEDGVIFISIDDNEVAQLRLLMDEIFGEENFRNQIAVKRGAKSVQSQFDSIDKLGIAYETVLLYTKNTETSLPKFYFDLEEEREGSWNNHWRGTERPTMRYEILGRNIDEGQWRWSKRRSEEAVKNYNLLLEDLKTEDPTQKEIDIWYQLNDEVDLLRLSSNGKPEHYVPATNKKFGHNLWVDLLVGKTASLKALRLNYFENPKNPDLLIRIIKWITKDNDIILDFFAGSGTTGDAVMQLNAEDGGSRKYILVQLPEKIDSKKNKTAYDFVKDELKVEEPTIFEMTKERLIRASKKIKEETIKIKIASKQREIKDLNGKLDLENKEEKIKQLKAEIKALENQDLGFKIFEIKDEV